MSDSIKRHWDSWSDEYFQKDMNDYGIIKDDPERAFPICDLSEKQIENAKRIADKNGWAIEFLCQDSRKLDKIGSDTYDLVYTSNGVHVWIDDLPGMYANFHRVL